VVSMSAVRGVVGGRGNEGSVSRSQLGFLEGYSWGMRFEVWRSSV